MATRKDLCAASRTNKVKIRYDLNNKVEDWELEGGEGIATFPSDLKGNVQCYEISKSIRSRCNLDSFVIVTYSVPFVF